MTDLISTKTSSRMDSELLQSVLQGRLDTFRSGAVCSPLPDAEFQAMDQNILYAWGLFTKLGFKEVCEFPFYMYGVSAEELEK